MNLKSLTRLKQQISWWNHIWLKKFDFYLFSFRINRISFRRSTRYNYSKRRKMILWFFWSLKIHRFVDFAFQESFIIHRVVNFSIYVIFHVVEISIIKHYICKTGNDWQNNLLTDGTDTDWRGWHWLRKITFD